MFNVKEQKHRKQKGPGAERGVRTSIVKINKSFHGKEKEAKRLVLGHAKKSF